MGIPQYLAMTAAELSGNPPAPHTAWMSCHFSPYHCGLSNLPSSLPPDSLLILDDATPMEGHDPEIIAQQLSQWITPLQCSALLLDFQRPDCAPVQALAAFLADTLPCPVGVSHLYAKELDCPVFLPPVTLHDTLESYFVPWTGREIWLETALDSQCLTLTEQGCSLSPVDAVPSEGYAEEKLHCHYTIETATDSASFTLWRTKEDVAALLAEAEGFGVTLAVGLWQELEE